MLSEIQSKLKAPKGQMNKFGGYRYRSCEDILEALKPILAEYGASIILTDDIVVRGDRIYVQATAVLQAEGVTHSATGFARESDTRKGMDDSQITGSASSYARKYALNGLFAIDDTQDADANNDHGKPERSIEDQVKSCQSVRNLTALYKGLSEVEQAKFKDLFSSRRAEIERAA